MTVALLAAVSSGLGAARELHAQGWEVAILSLSGQGEALAKALGGLSVCGSNESEDGLRRLPDGTGYVTAPNIRRDGSPARTT